MRNGSPHAGTSTQWPVVGAHELRDRGGELRDRQPLRTGELQDRRQFGAVAGPEARNLDLQESRVGRLDLLQPR